jgi:hypothetical protein
MISHADLEKINAERRRKGQEPITRRQAIQATQAAADNSTAFDFLMGLSGIPWPSAMGMLGFAISDTDASAQPASYDSTTSDSFSSGGGTFDGGGSTSDYGGSDSGGGGTDI